MHDRHVSRGSDPAAAACARTRHERRLSYPGLRPGVNRPPDAPPPEIPAPPTQYPPAAGLWPAGYWCLGPPEGGAE